MATKHRIFFVIAFLLSFQNVVGAASDRFLQENHHGNITHSANTSLEMNPTSAPTESPAPSPSPSAIPTYMPTTKPSSSPTKAPTAPSESPTESPAPSPSPSQTPTMLPTRSPTVSPSASPTVSERPSTNPSGSPTSQPSSTPTRSQKPSSRMQPYSASGVEIVFEKVAAVLEMDERDVALFESTTRKLLQNDFSSSHVNEIVFLKVEMKEQKMMSTRRNLRDFESLQNYADLAISFDVTALANHDWGVPFDLKESMTLYFGTDNSVEKLRTNLEAAGATFLKESTGNGGNSMSLGVILGIIAGLLVTIVGIAVAYRRRGTTFKSKLSLASTGSNDEEDESSDAQMIIAGQNIYGGNILSFPSPTSENGGIEASFFGSSRPAFLTMDSNIEIPDTPVGFTPQGSKPGSFATDTPNSLLGPQNNSTRSVGFRKFLMDTPPSAMNANKASRGFFRPPRSGGPQKNLTPRKDTIDMPTVEPTIVDSDKVDLSPVTFPTDFTDSKVNQKQKLNPSRRDTQTKSSKSRLRQWSSGYFSDESTP